MILIVLSTLFKVTKCSHDLVLLRATKSSKLTFKQYTCIGYLFPVNSKSRSNIIILLITEVFILQSIHTICIQIMVHGSIITYLSVKISFPLSFYNLRT